MNRILILLAALSLLSTSAADIWKKVSNPSQPEARLTIEGGAFKWVVAGIDGIKPTTALVDVKYPRPMKVLRATWKNSAGVTLRKENYVLPPFDEFRKKLDNERLKIKIPFEMPFDGKVTVVVDDLDGVRVKNVLKGMPYKKGTHTVVWDGYSEDGILMKPGEYKIRVAVHPGLNFDYLGYFASGKEKDMWIPWGPNHVALSAGLRGKNKVVVGSIFTEGGHSRAILDLNGNFLFGYHDHWFSFLNALYLVNGASNRFYSVTYTDGALSVSGYRWDKHERVKIKIGKKGPELSITGAAVIGSKLYVGNSVTSQIDVYDLFENEKDTTVSYSGKSLPMPIKGPVDVWNGELVTSPKENLISMTTDGKKIYAVEKGCHQILVFDFKTRRQIGFIGEPGGGYTGLWKKNRLVNPKSVTLDDNGKLWVTENRFAPKRLTRWNPVTGECEYEKFGPSAYGFPGTGFDPEDPSLWMANDVLWRYDGKRDEPVAVVLAADSARNQFSHGTGFSETKGGNLDSPFPTQFMHYKFIHRSGRTFVWGLGKTPTLFELKDNVFKPLSFFSYAHLYFVSILAHRGTEGHGKILRAYMKAFPHVKEKDAYKTFLNDRKTFVFWSDKNGNGDTDEDEFQFSSLFPAGGYWGFWPETLDFNLPVNDVTTGKNYILPFRGPDYDFEKIIANKKPVTGRMPQGQSSVKVESFADSRGRTVLLTATPCMYGISPEGKIDWMMDNPWPCVHGAHKAPLPQTGELQGILFSMGVAPYSEKADVCAAVNDHGRVFFITTDGMYIDELFNDCRVSSKNDENLVGGEPFGGVFSYDNVNKEYVLQAGGYRKYRINGLDKVRESNGKITVSQEQISYAEKHPPQKDGEVKGPQSASIPAQLKWRNGGNDISVEVSEENGFLKICWAYPDSSQWVNNGLDPYMMFKTGDSVDIQFLNAESLPERLLISPKAGEKEKTQVVHYRHKVSDKEKRTGLNPMGFSSPWRTHKVDDVRVVDNVRTIVHKTPARIYITAFIPQEIIPSKLIETGLKCDIGVIFGDVDGKINLSRSYWSNKATGLVNDVPGEIIPDVKAWGTLTRLGVGANKLAKKKVANEKLYFAGSLVNPHGLTANPSPADDWDRKHSHELETYGAGPVWCKKRQLLFTSAGKGKARAIRLDGRLVAEYNLPRAGRFYSYDNMVLTEKGDLFVLAGGWDCGQPHSRYRKEGGKLYLIRGTPSENVDATLISSDVCAISSSEKDGKIAIVRRISGDETRVTMMDTGTLKETFFATIPTGEAGIYANMYDWLPDGRFACVYQDDGVRILENGKEKGEAVFLFQGRETKMMRGKVIGDYIWSLRYDTLKRMNAKTFKADPGVVLGGNSGYFIGHVQDYLEINLQGICEVGKNLYAVLSRGNASVWILYFDEKEKKMKPVRRIGGITEPVNFAIDPEGGVLVDNILFDFYQNPLDPPLDALSRMPERAAAILPTGELLRVYDGHNDKVRFSIGKIKTKVDQRIRDSERNRPKSEDYNQFRRWSSPPFRTDLKVIKKDNAKTEYELHAIYTNGVKRVYSTQANGHLKWKDWYKEEACEKVPDGVYFAQDGEYYAETNLKDGTLKLYTEMDGKKKLLDTYSGLKEPAKVAISNGRIIVWERKTQRVLRFLIK